MQMTDFFIENNGKISFTREMGSKFAKRIAGDFNPIHDEENKRFCVPGDLLFSVVLHKFGISEKMHVTFAGMVVNNVDLDFIKRDTQIIVRDDNKEYLSVDCSGENQTDEQAVSALIQQYVAFSGQTFPHILVPLMENADVMINPARPLVIYESMSLDMEQLNFSDPQLELSSSSLDVEGKRGTATLNFDIKAQDKIIGHGSKRMVLSSLRPYEADKINVLAKDYGERKQQYLTA